MASKETDECLALLYAMQAAMLKMQVLAERLSGYMLELEARGMSLPNMHKTVKTLAEIALGWQSQG